MPVVKGCQEFLLKFLVVSCAHQEVLWCVLGVSVRKFSGFSQEIYQKNIVQKVHLNLPKNLVLTIFFSTDCIAKFLFKFKISR